jgi:two-component system response regulator FlrC
MVNEELFGKDEKVLDVLKQARNLASLKGPVLVSGELGTGKKTLCIYIHEHSLRKEKTILIVDCGQEKDYIEKKILGHREEDTGRFQKGVLEEGNGGTVVLANIECLDEHFQKKLFKIILELPDYDIDVRIMVTSSKNLAKLVGIGRFHRALYNYFISGQISIPSLRERRDDISYIFTKYLENICLESNRIVPIVSQEVFNKIYHYYWSHNISEIMSVVNNTLDNLVAEQIDLSSFIMGEKKIHHSHSESDEDGVKLMSLKEAERLLIKKALIHTSENRTQAAKILGVSIRTLRNKINEYRSEGANYFINLR